MQLDVHNGQVTELKSNGHFQIVFSWDGLPQYAARLIRAVIERLGEGCVVVGSRPRVPVKGIEEALGQDVFWIDDASKPLSWKDLGIDIPAIYIQSGWSYPAFAALGREVKASGGKVIGLSDANWRGDFRQIVLGFIGFRLFYRGYFDAMVVPGRQGRRLMRYFGVREDCLRIGMYGADPDLFHGGAPLPEREKRFLYVGQFIERKNILSLARAFLKFSDARPGWTLHLVGCGEQREMIPRDDRIVVEDFVQPEQLAKRYRAARFFVLPSKQEAWGLVVHEAALCGCGLILSDAIGSADDLAASENGIRFRARSEEDLTRALIKAADFEEEQLMNAEEKSRELAQQFGPERFSLEVSNLISELRSR